MHCPIQALLEALAHVQASNLRNLVLVVVVDALVPAEAHNSQFVRSSHSYRSRSARADKQLTRESRIHVSPANAREQKQKQTHLVTITPLVILGANVLVRVLGALLQRRHVAPVLPVLSPEPVGVGAGSNQAGDNTAFPKSLAYVCAF